MAARLLSKTIFISLLVLLVLTAIPHGASAVWWEMVFACAVFGIGILWMIEGLFDGSWGAGNSDLLLPLIFLAAYAYLQTVSLWGANAAGVWRPISADPYETRLFVIKLSALILFFFLLYRYVNSVNRLKALVFVIVGIAVASALFGMWRQAAQAEAFGPVFPIKRDIGYAQFINKNHFAMLAEAAIGLLLGLVVGGGVRQKSLLIYLALLAPLCAGLALANSRGGILALTAQLLLLVLFYSLQKDEQSAQSKNPSSRIRRIAAAPLPRIGLIIMFAVMMWAAVVWTGGERLAGSLEATRSEVASSGDLERANVRRVDIWSATLKMIKDYPVAGTGFGGYWIAITKYHDASGRWSPQEAHNDYLELMASGGIIAVGLAVWFGAVFIRRAAKRLRQHSSFRRSACLGSMVALAGIAAHSSIDFGLHITINAAVFMALIAISASDKKFESVASARALDGLTEGDKHGGAFS